MFYCKFNDPIYLKMEKLDILIRLVNGKSIGNVLQELRVYASDVELEFGKKAIGCIGRCAIKLPDFVDTCVGTLQEIITL